jgi:hypothetical protein
VLHAWTAQLHALLPDVRVTRGRGLALFTVGMAQAGTVRVNRVARALRLGVRVLSTERRLRRFLANPQVTVAAVWQPLLPHLLARWADREAVLVFDPTPFGATWTILWVGIVVHRRVLPLTWRLVPQQTPWPETLETLLPALLAPIAAALPPRCRVTLLGDRGVAGPTLLDAAQPLGWDVVMRLNVGPTQTHRVRLLAVTDGAGAACAPDAEQPLWDLVGTVGTGWSAAAQIFKGAGWRTGFLTVARRTGLAEPWILFSTRPGGRARVRPGGRARVRPGGRARVRQYAQRGRVDATFGDGKRRGWGLEQSHVREAAHLARLLLVWHLALWWLHALGRYVITGGHRTQFARTDRRDLSLVQLAWLWLLACLESGRCPPLLFRQSPTGWHARGTP